MKFFELKKKILRILNESGFTGLTNRLIVRLIRLVQEFFEFSVDFFKSTYGSQSAKTSLLINRIIKESFIRKDLIKLPQLIINRYLHHQFDLLGSGWTRIHHGMDVRGLEGYRYQGSKKINADSKGLWLANKINQSNLSESKKIWQLVDSSYVPIDWQLDFKSGYRWSEKTWYKYISHGKKKGVDIKVPWELARMQHLPQMALKYINLLTNSKQKEQLPKEFRNQILDFLATNPPHFGVNWSCPMDVSIRASNWLLTYDLFRSSGFVFDKEFEDLFIQSIINHGHNIVNNLEWSKADRANHYLADIAGLVFISSFLPSSKETDAWLAFSVQELINEVGHQFYPDGSNFEGSTSYHRLSSEMVIFSTALILGLSPERQAKLKDYDCKYLKTSRNKPNLKKAPLLFYSFPNSSLSSQELTLFPAWYFEKIERMIDFTVDMIKPDGHFPQIGDNDSGRFFKLSPSFKSIKVSEAKQIFGNLKGYKELPDDEIYFMEDHLNCDHLIAAGYALFKRDDFANKLGGHNEAVKSPDYSVVEALSGNTKINSQQSIYSNEKPHVDPNKEAESIFHELIQDLEKKSNDFLIKEFKQDHLDLQEGLNIKGYPDFGLYIYKSDRFYLAIRCWPGRLPYDAGHMHLDQLSIELMIDGEELVSDLGSYIYTPFPKTRWKYRLAESHFTPFISNHNQSEDMDSPFSPIIPEPAIPSYFGLEGFLVRSKKSNSNYCYIVHIKKNKIKIYFSGFKRKQLRPLEELPKSIGYGIFLT